MNNKKNIIFSTSVNTILTSILEVYCRRSFSSISDFQRRWFSGKQEDFLCYIFLSYTVPFPTITWFYGLAVLEQEKSQKK